MAQPNMQASLAFLQSQTAHIEEQVYEIRLPSIQYPTLVDVDTSANPWVTSVTYYSSETGGEADWLADAASDIPMVGHAMAQHDKPVEMAGIGYDYGLAEINRAMMLDINLDVTKASAARRRYEEMIDRVVLNGDEAKGFSGLFNHPDIPVTVAPNGASGSALFVNKTAAELLKDVNAAIVGVHDQTNSVEIADTVIMPHSRLATAAEKTIDGTSMTVLQFIRENNFYTLETGLPLTIRGARGLETAGAGGTARMLAYRKDPEVMKVHVPMPIQFLDVQVVGTRFIVPGIFSIGGLDVRLPFACQYKDGI